jgi:hypothetical protein
VGCVPKVWVELSGKPTGCSRKRRRPHPKLVQSFLVFLSEITIFHG